MSLVTIELTGVAVVGPGWPRKKEGAKCKVDGPFYAVMPASKRRRNAWSLSHPNEPRSFIPVHFPVILTQSNSWDESERIPDVELPEIPWFIWFPHRERLELVIDNDSKPGEIIFEHSKDANDDGEPEGDIHHVADMRRICRKRSELRRAVRPGRKVSAPVAREVAAHVLIPRGYIRSRFRRLDMWKAKFDPIQTDDGKPLVQCLAPELLISFEVEERLEIRSWSLDTGAQLDSIVFNPTEDIAIRFANADPSDMFAYINSSSGAPVDSSRDGDRDYDFELYYDLLKGRGKKLSVPVDYNPEVGFLRNCYLVFTGSGGG